MFRQLTSEQRPEQVTGSPQPGAIPLSIDEVTRTFTLFTSFRERCASVSPLRALAIDDPLVHEQTLRRCGALDYGGGNGHPVCVE
jgi:hypothetical protein